MNIGQIASTAIRKLKAWSIGKMNSEGFIERTKNNVDTPLKWEPFVTERLCAKGDGATAYMTMNSAVNFVYTKDFSIEYLWQVKAIDVLKTLFGSSSDTLDYFHQTENNDNQIGMFDAGIGTSRKVFFTSAFLIDNTYHIDSSYSKTTKLWTITRTNLTSGVDNETANIDCTGYNFDLQINRLFSRGYGDRFLPDSICCLKMSIDGVLVTNYPLELSGYDISGNANHLTNYGVDLGATYENANGVYSYNLNNGFDLYSKDGTDPVEYMEVPYVDGSPVVSSVTGYTKVSEHPAGFHFNNSSIKFVPFSTGHDGTGWVVPQEIKDIDTDFILHNETTGYAIEFDRDTIQDILTADSDYVFIDLSEENKVKNLMLYREPLTGVELVKARKFCNYEESWDNVTLNLTLTTTSDSESVSIEKVMLSEESEIDWGDGNTTTLNAETDYVPLSHTYASAGSYTAKIKKPSSITQIWIRNNKISGFHSAQLRFADVYDLRCNNLGTAKECVVKSEHMTSWIGYYWMLHSMPSGTYNIDSSDLTSWTGYYWQLHSMPSGTYNIDSSDMTSWTGGYWQLYSMPSGTYNIDSSDMTSWTGYSWLLRSMPSGTYNIDSAHMVDWTGTAWYLYSMPSGTYNIDSAHMVDWTGTIWILYSMPSGTYNIDSSDMTSWTGQYWRLYSMPSGTYNIGASTIRNWTTNEVINLYNLEDSVSGLNVLATESECIKVIDDIYAGRLTFRGTPVLILTGTNADITDAGTRTKIDHLRAGDDGVDTFQPWEINVNGYPA